MLTFNKCLYDCRIQKGLSLKIGAKVLCVKKHVLYNAENGYCTLPDYAIDKASRFYGVDFKKLSKDSYGYSIPNKRKENKKLQLTLEKIYKFSQSLVARILTIILLVLSIGGIVTSSIVRQYTKDNPEAFLSSDYTIYREYILKNGKKDMEYLIDENGLLDNAYSVLGESKKYNGSVYQFSVSNINIFDYSHYQSYFDTDNYICFETYYDNILSGLNMYTLEFRIATQSNDDVKFYGTISINNKDSFVPIKMYRSLEKDDSKIIHEGDKDYQTVIDNLNKYLPISIEIKNEGLKSIGVNANIYDFTKTNIKNIVKYEVNVFPTYIYLFVILTAVFLILSLFSYSSLISKLVKKENKNNTLRECEFEIEGVKVAHYRPLPVNVGHCPPIKERVEQIIGVVFLLFAGIGTVLGVANMLGMIDGEMSTDVASISTALSSFSSISVVLLLYNNLDIMSKKKNISASMLFFIFAGIIFYIFETIAIEIVAKSSIKEIQKIKEDLLAILMPGNFFFGMALYSSVAMFIFTTPESCNTRKKIYIWRSLVVIPLSYFAVGFVFNELKQLGYYVSPYVQCIFYSKNVYISLFAFISLFLTYIFKRNSYMTFGKKNAEIYMSGNEYAYWQNMTNAILITIIYILSVLLPQLIAGTFNFGLGESLYIFILIPLMIFCAHRKEARNTFGDIMYNVIYALVMMLPYIISIGLINNKIIYLLF